MDTQHMNPSTLWKAALISEGKIRYVHNPFHCKTVTRDSIYDMTKT